MPKHERATLNQNQSEIIKQWAEILLTFLVFGVLLLFSYTLLFLRPYIGFYLNNGTVSAVNEEAQGYVQKGDVILSINDVIPQDFNKSIKTNPTIQTPVGGILHIELLRDGNKLQVDLPKPEKNKLDLFEFLSGEWVIPYPFFIAGMITILFIRPRSKTRTLLYLFFFCFAIWISAGQISSTGYWASNVVMRVLIWLSVPITFHLHWYFPYPFKPLKKWSSAMLYAIPGLLAILDLLGIIPSGSYLIGFVLSMGSALLLLVIKLIKFKQLRSILWPLLGSYLLAVVPLLFMAVMMLFSMAPPQSNIALIGLVAIPGFYFFTAYKTSLKEDVPRINIAMNLFTGGIVITFILSFIVAITPALIVNPTVLQLISFGANFFIGLTGFGVLLIMPALAHDQIDLFQNQAYSLRFSANRVATFVNYLFFITPIYLLFLLLLPENQAAPLAVTLYAAAIAVLGTGISILTFRYFLKFFDKVVLGIKVPPESLIHKFTQKITLSLDYANLGNLLKEEVLPSLMIRESVMVFEEGQSSPRTIFRTGVSDEDYAALMDQIKRRRSNQQPLDSAAIQALPWVKLALPLNLEDHSIGFWCFGWRDPNNVYDQEFETVLKTLANQISITLLNIHQGELLQTLYNINVERQEAEKASIARDLHDVLLPALGYLVELQGNDTDQWEFEKAVQQINDMVRDIMSGLRPSSLDMGLDVALEELADQPEAQIGGKIQIATDLQAPIPLNYDQNVELHLYRIVQQACHNAYEHANAQSILITGLFKKDEIRLSVTDDGNGLPFQGMPNLSELLSNHHFGLANIFERAKLIDAELSLQSSPKRGTKLEITWHSKTQD